MPLVTFEGVKVPRWVRAELRRARRGGWRGTVISGWRSDEAQLAAAGRYAASLGKPVSAVYPHGPLASNHCGRSWPRGAVDVTDPAGLERALSRVRPPDDGRELVWAGPLIGDWSHFSSNGH